MKISWSSQIATLVSLFTSGTLRADAQVPTFLVYENSACEGTPSSVAFYGTNYCSNYNLNQCATDGHYSYSITCAYFSTSYTDTLFADTPYLITQLYTAYCGSLVGAYVWPLNSDECHPMPPITGTVGVEVVLNADNSLTTEYATDNTCDDMNHATKVTYPSAMINTGYCVGGNTRFYVRSPTTTTGTTTTGGTTTTTGTTGTTTTGTTTTTGGMTTTTGGMTTTTTTSLSPSGASTDPHVAPVAIAALAMMVQAALGL
ncbi:hypothetical protein PF010_g11236 [Phytophthora fragariae]|uniref:Uncharacterized protein n=1 Tax=Phytophthora fragariae TaxID=53985 RepID=A0A6G0NZZ0_9STRA|nr:hypothetical protein PF010_g11236 [Phytophthora fragariae]KAE9229412.1 hypothetical protein PF004_g10790 [Phytophthora fragariae]KAE9311649.1 hypothetical protein PF008_g20156 [Phytophthora fragariae]